LVKLSAKLNREAVRKSKKRKLKEESAFTGKERRTSTKIYQFVSTMAMKQIIAGCSKAATENGSNKCKLHFWGQ
jgi:hypothetical protein